MIIPCYNQGKYLQEAIDSVTQQTYPHVEIIVVNDGSTDVETINILKQIQNNKILVLHKENGHLSSARNYGIKHCKGKYFLPLDADDKLHPTFIEKTLSILSKSETIAAVSSWSKYFEAKNNVNQLKGGDINNFLRYNNCTATALIKKEIWEIVGGYDESMKDGFEDWDFYINVTKRGYRIEMVSEPLFLYRVKKNTKSLVDHAISKRPEIYRYIIEKHKDVFDKHYPEIIYQLEKQLIEQQQIFLNSTTYKIGRAILFFKWW